MSILVYQRDKTPTESLTYTWYFGDWEAVRNSRIASATVSQSPSGLTIGTLAVSSDGRSVSVRISGGSNAVVYRLRCEATTAAGDVIDGYLDLNVAVPT